MSPADVAIAYAEKQLGKPYEFGATGPDSYDCSGLTFKAYEAAGVHIGRVTEEQILNGTNVNKPDLLPGDLVFPNIGHVGLMGYGGIIIEAPHTGAFVKHIPLSQFGFWRARRVTTPGTGSASPSELAGTPVETVGIVDDTKAAFKAFNKLAETLANPDWWKRLGLGVLGLFIILIAVAFINRRSIASTTVGTVKAAGKVAALA
jgi:hypothetical protein